MGERMAEFVEGGVRTVFAACADQDAAPDFWNMDELALRYQGLVLAPLPLEENEHLVAGYDALEDKLVAVAQEKYAAKMERLGPEISAQLLKFVFLQILDENWRDHLNELIMLRSGIGLRSYGQRDPLVEYKAESYRLFEEMMERIENQAVNLFFRAELAPPPRPAAPEVSAMETRHQEVSAYDQAMQSPAAGRRPEGPAGEPARGRPVQRELPKVGRNDPCPCGSGRKYKKCCGAGG
mgnify:CR=1 FL=1